MRTKQEPIHSGFGATTTARQAVHGLDLTAKVAIVTGGYSGIGLETTRSLAEAGATVIVPARNQRKAHEALNGIPRVEQEQIDLLNPASIDAFANRFLASGRQLHLLINNAGVMAPPLGRDWRGYESQFSANHLGHFQLTARLWPALRSASGARVVALSSRAHQRAGIDFDDPHFCRRAYDRWEAYGQSKTANVLFAVELDRRGEADNVRAFSVHPGAVLTELIRYMTDEELRAYDLTPVNGRVSIAAGKSVDEGGEFKTTAQGAATSVWCATSPRLAGMGGVYCLDSDIGEVLPSDLSTGAGVLPRAIDPKTAERLWTLSEELTGARI